MEGKTKDVMKKKKILHWCILMIGALAITSCGERRPPAVEDAKHIGSELKDAGQQAFMNNLAMFCGQSFRGQQIFMAEGRESWALRQFVMHVTVCEDDRVYIPFHLDDDESRTWMFLVEDGRLRIRHDHRHADGTPEEVTMYGGYADESGTGFWQNFPADDYTCDMLPNSCHAQWRVELSQDLQTFSYALFNYGELLFRAEFDLGRPL
jgi:hypothetical protein